MENLSTFIKKHSIEWIETTVVDLSGQARGRLTSAASFHNKSTPKLPFDVLMQTVNGRYASVQKGLSVNPQDRDMALIADVNSAYILPWSEKPTLSLICDTFDLEGNALEQHSRQLLRRVLKLYQDKGWQPIIAPELEFFIFKPINKDDRELQQVNGKNNHFLSTKQPYSTERISEFDDFFHDVINHSKAQGITLESIIQEAANGQFELNLHHGEALKKADEIFQLKRTIREVAKRHGMHASFMAKPLANAEGSSMHIHQSVIDVNTQQNLFSDAKGNNSALFNGYIGGLKHYLPEAVALFMPYVNSYRRLVPDVCAPLNVEWAYDNRTVGLRVPLSYDNQSTFDANRRVENRLAGADCNPYLVSAVCLALGYEGMLKQTDPGQPFVGSAYDKPISFVRNLDNALDLLSQSSVLRRLLGEKFIATYCAVKQKELNDFYQSITPWEITNLSGVI